MAKKVKFVGFTHADYYHGRGGRWGLDEVKELQDEDADALLSDFAGAGKGTKFPTHDRAGAVLDKGAPKPAFVKA